MSMQLFLSAAAECPQLFEEDCNNPFNFRLETVMKWSKPQATEMRFGFEITMYINNR